MSDTIDLQTYFARIGYQGPHAPTEQLLHALTAAHTQAIPFENIDVLLGRPIALEPAALQAKLVTAGRGGYCFEQNGLFLAVLRQLGFDVRPLGARVRLGQPDRRIAVQRTHMLLEVQMARQAWITDVGVGGASLTRALRLQAGLQQPTPHETRRLVYEDGRWFHQMRRGDTWVDVYEFTQDEMPRIDRTVANWYTSTHPDSVFRQHLMVSLAQPDGVRLSLRNQSLSRRQSGGAEKKQTIDNADQMLQVLHQSFGIDLPADTPLRPGSGAWLSPRRS